MATLQPVMNPKYHVELQTYVHRHAVRDGAVVDPMSQATRLQPHAI